MCGVIRGLAWGNAEDTVSYELGEEVFNAGHSDDDEATTLIFEALTDRDHPHGNAVVALWDDAEKLAVLIRAQQVIDELGATDLEDARRRLLK